MTNQNFENAELMTTSPSLVKKENHCRSCGYEALDEILDLGTTPLANGLVSPNGSTVDEFRAPLILMNCSKCHLLQLSHTVSPEVLFTHYLYFSSFSETMLRHAVKLTDDTIEQYELTTKDLVVEVASNDGYLLKNYVKKGIPVLGIEPAKNIAATAENSGVRTIPVFFNKETVAEITKLYGQASIIHANNVMAHVSNINEFVESIYLLLNDKGVAIIEVPYALDMIDNVEFDTIYHEHIFYFFITAIESTCRRKQLFLNSVQRIPIHGGSVRLFFSKESKPDDSVNKALADEAIRGVTSGQIIANFAQEVHSFKARLNELLKSLKKENKTIGIYGASAKGATLLNFLNANNDLPAFLWVADKSTIKQGLLTPGTQLRIVSPELIEKDKPDYLLLLAWNFADEIMSQQIDYLQLGGKIIIPLPELRIIEL